jgi:NDP-sugar pyrophosphorylase family protein
VLDGVTGYINAGGRGTRLNQLFTPDPKVGIAKALLEIGRSPTTLIHHQINKMRDAELTPVVAGVGDHGHVAEHVRTAYAAYPDVHAVQASIQLGTGGDLLRAFRAHHQLFKEHILVSNVDTILDIDEAELIELHRKNAADMTVAVTLDKGVPNEGAYYVGANSVVIYCAEAVSSVVSEKLAAERCSYQASSTGSLVVERDFLRDISWTPDDGPLSLYRDVVGYALGSGQVPAYNNGNRLFIDVGTLDSWRSAEENPESLQPYIHYH